ncbi:MAG: N-6 DNA methylase, partial [Holosporales bacterium]|nr:N-6 DNA methylase [Holosporales bacterium]
NTLGKLCADKKTELKIDESEYFTDKKRQLATRKKLDEKLKTYRQWLLGLSICDPACGSGAFLNAALDFLITEHNLLDEMSAKLLGGGLVFPDVENAILENNLYGVDINEESVEIAKLALWLRTTKPNRKLNSLNNNIKCGNSLISDPEVAGDKAFDWEREFPQVFEKGGVDVVIGNPPYVPTEYIAQKDKIYLENNYKSAFGRINLYPVFYEKGLLILREWGVLGFITPYTIIKNQYYKEARKYIIENSTIMELIDFKGIVVFQDAAVDSIILLLQKEQKENYLFKQITEIKNFESRIYTEDFYNIDEVKIKEDLSMLLSKNDYIAEKAKENSLPLSEIINFNQGIITGGNSKYITNQPSELTQKVITGSSFNRYLLSYDNQYIIYDVNSLHRPRKKEIFESSEKLLLRQTGAFPISTLDTNQYYTLDTVHNGLLINKDFSIKYILVVLNSRLVRFLYENSINESGKVFAQVKIIYIDPLPIKQISLSAQQPFIEKADLMLSLNAELQVKRQRFLSRLKDNFENIKLTGALEKFDESDFKGFVAELKKQKVSLSLKQQDEWGEYFSEYKSECNQLSSHITEIDRVIDEMVYELYGLTEEEIGVVEANNNKL